MVLSSAKLLGRAHKKVRILFLFSVDESNATRNGEEAETINFERSQAMFGCGNALHEYTSALSVIESGHVTEVIVPSCSDDGDDDSDRVDEIDDKSSDSSSDSGPGVELCCGNVGILPALLVHQFNKLRRQCNSSADIPAFNAHWAGDHIFVHCRKSSPSTQASPEGYTSASHSTLAEEFSKRNITHVIPTTVATAKFFLQNPGIFDSLPSCGSVYPSRYSLALASQTEVLGRALSTIWERMSPPDGDPLVANVSHVLHKAKGNKRSRNSHPVDSWNNAIDSGGEECSWIEEGMVIYALTLEANIENGVNDGSLAFLYELEVAAGKSRKLQLTDAKDTDSGNVFARVYKRNGDSTKVNAPLDMDPKGSWVVFSLDDGFTATGITYTIDCHRSHKHSGSFPPLRIVRSGGSVMTQSTWTSLGKAS